MGHRIQRMMQGIRRTVVVVASLSVIATGVAVLESSLPNRVVDRQAASGWGGEALTESSGKESTFSLIGVANACGLGASSCFKCHNGSRAAAPNMDEASAPWHAQHHSVNHSCAGCHDGNPRIIRKEMAHRNLIADPKQTPERSCVSCHKDDSSERLNTYLSVASGGK